MQTILRRDRDGWAAASGEPGGGNPQTHRDNHTGRERKGPTDDETGKSQREFPGGSGGHKQEGKGQVAHRPSVELVDWADVVAVGERWAVGQRTILSIEKRRKGGARRQPLARMCVCVSRRTSARAKSPFCLAFKAQLCLCIEFFLLSHCHAQPANVAAVPRLRRAATHADGNQFNEFRHNLATGEWVVFSSSRRGRPQQV